MPRRSRKQRRSEREDHRRLRDVAWLRWVVVAVGVALRLWAARGELWLDELISLWQAVHASSWLAIFDGIHSDNNHYLTSLWLRLSWYMAFILAVDGNW